jgi:energy-coupling factor transporter ATP-binding protein EcfA2
MNKLTALSITKLRNVVPTTLEFRPGLNVVLGKNGTGKSTLLRLLASTLNADEGFRDEALELRSRVSSDALDVEHSVSCTRVEQPEVSLASGQVVSEAVSVLQRVDSLAFERHGQTVLRGRVLPNELFFEGEALSGRVDRVFPGDAPWSLGLALMMARTDPESKALAQEILSSRVVGAYRLDEGLERFQRLLELEFELVRAGYRVKSPRGPEEFPQSFFKVLRGPVPEGSSEASPLDFLDRAARILGYDAALARFDVERLGTTPGQQVVRLSNLRFFFKTAGEELAHDMLSYGQKRLLSFFAYADASRDVLIADEWVGGLHHEWISACLREVGERQVFLTSQNPLLLDALRFSSAEDVRRAFVLCERVRGDTGTQLLWRNPSRPEAEDFYAAYQKRVQRVSDILLAHGFC